MITGRKQEIRELNRLYDSGRSELVAVYGRLGAGKTFLVNMVFEGRLAFRHAGLFPQEIKKGAMRAQLKNFYNSLVEQGMTKSRIPGNWFDAFLMLEQFLKERDTAGKRQVVFLDELPWLDTPRSGFITAFESFWNNWGCHRRNLMVIVCGSASSWILDNMINSHGGLYDRITWEIKLSPFTLAECEEFFAMNKVRLSRYDIAQSYMILGGIPYYLRYFEPEKSLAQNIDNLLFSAKAKLRNEYDRLFSSAFRNPETMKAIVAFLYRRASGFMRSDIMEGLGISDGGSLTEQLNALITSDFVVRYIPFGAGKREARFRLTDPFCIFYLRFKDLMDGRSETFWQHGLHRQDLVSWRGLAYERLCFNHIRQIKKALGIGGVHTSESSWSKRSGAEDGMQIDLLISRADNVVNMCEIKYCSDDFCVDREYYRTILRRQEVLSGLVSRKTAVRSTLITTFGLKPNEYSGVFVNVITLDDLFSD